MINERILLTGGAGYIGMELAPKLLARGCEVVVLDRFIHEPRFDARSDLRVVEGDIRNPEAVVDAVDGCTTVIHLAGVSIDGATTVPHAIAASINRDAFEPLLRACIDARVTRFVFASTCSVYENHPPDVVDETVAPRPTSPYALWKYECEHVLTRYGDRIEGVILRAATVCGPSRRQRFDLMINQMIAQACLHERITIERPAAIRPSVHIDDLTDAYVVLANADAEAVRGQVFHCAYENRSVLETALLIQDVIGPTCVEIDERTPSAVSARSYIVDSAKIAAVGVRPRKGVRDAASELAGAFGEGRFRDALTNPLYVNRAAEARSLL